MSAFKNIVYGTGVETAIGTTLNATGGLVSTNGTATLTNKTLTSPIITNIAPGANFTLTQNSVVPFTSVQSGAVVNTLYLTGGNIGVGLATPSGQLHIYGKNVAQNLFRAEQIYNVAAAVFHASADHTSFSQATFFCRNKGTGDIFQGWNNVGEVFSVDNSGNIDGNNITAGGTLDATDDATLSGADNTAPNQTVTGIDSLMTIETLTDGGDYMFEWDDFFGGDNTVGMIGKLGWRLGVNGVLSTSVTNCSFQATAADHPGIYQIGTGTTDNDHRHILLCGSSQAHTRMSTGTKIKFVVNITSVSDVGYFIGLSNSSTGLYDSGATRYLAVRADTDDGDTVFYVVEKDGGSETKTSTGVSFATGWHVIEIEITSTGTSATVTVDGTPINVSTAIFVSAGNGFPVAEVRTRTTSSKTLQIDYYSDRELVSR